MWGEGSRGDAGGVWRGGVGVYVTTGERACVRLYMWGCMLVRVTVRVCVCWCTEVCIG